jgi:hypothetical protein
VIGTLADAVPADSALLEAVRSCSLLTRRSARSVRDRTASRSCRTPHWASLRAGIRDCFGVGPPANGGRLRSPGSSSIVTIDPSSCPGPGGPGKIAVNRFIVVPGFAWGLEIWGGRSPARTGWPVHEARPVPGAASCLGGEEFIVIGVIVMGCGLVLPGGAA